MHAKVAHEITAAVDALKPELIDTLQQLVRIPSVTGNEGTAQAAVAQLYADAGLAVQVLEVDEAKVKAHPAYSARDLGYDGRPNIIARFGGDPARKSIILNGHIDVVSPEPVADWRYDPWGAAIDGGRLYGRGAADMKAGLVANLFALKALTKQKKKEAKRLGKDGE